MAPRLVNTHTLERGKHFNLVALFPLLRYDCLLYLHHRCVIGVESHCSSSALFAQPATLGLGRLFTGPSATRASSAPLISFAASLGSAALWPVRPSAATGHQLEATQKAYQVKIKRPEPVISARRSDK